MSTNSNARYKRRLLIERDDNCISPFLHRRLNDTAIFSRPFIYSYVPPTILIPVMECPLCMWPDSETYEITTRRQNLGGERASDK
jgi:hypothetical protein